MSEEVARAIDALGLDTEECRILPAAEGRLIFERLQAQCVRGPHRTWWWEALAEPSAAHRFDNSAYALDLIVPDPGERVWFIADSDHPGFVVCDTSVVNARRIIGECYGCEYVIGSKDGTWVIGENHHDVVWVVGTTVVDGLKRAAEQGDAADKTGTR